MSARPGSFGYFRLGQPYRFMSKGSTGGFNYFRRGQPFRGLIMAASGTVYTETATGGVQVGSTSAVFKAFVATASGGLESSAVAPNSVTVVTSGGWPLVGGGPTRSPLARDGGSAMYLGDFGVGQSVSTKFPTTKSDGTPASLSAGAASVYRTGSTTESTAGVTLTADYDARTGFNSLVVDTSADATFYTPGAEYQVVLTAGTVNAVSVVGQPVASFSIRNRPAPVMSAPFSNAGIHGAGG